MAVLVAKKGMYLSGCIDDYPEGIIIPIDKPYRWTSADVIRKVKYNAIKHFHKKNLKVGHAGTLDPLATGVLLVCIGKATKLADELQKHEKQYLAGVSFGATTPSYDREKEIDKLYPVDGVSEDALRSVLPTFLGEQEQVAPLFSAKSVDGVRAYELARKAYKTATKEGSDFDHTAAELLSRQKINIPAIELISWADRYPGLHSAEPENEAAARINVIPMDKDIPHADILVNCSKGTYIRALARDLGEALGSGAFLDDLRRTRTGSFGVEESLSINDALALLAEHAPGDYSE